MAGKVVISVRVPADVAEAIDKARGAQSRSSWAEQVLTEKIDMDTYEAEQAATFKRNRRAATKTDTPQCPPHPKGRVIKGFCYRCGKPAT